MVVRPVQKDVSSLIVPSSYRELVGSLGKELLMGSGGSSQDQPPNFARSLLIKQIIVQMEYANQK